MKEPTLHFSEMSWRDADELLKADRPLVLLLPVGSVEAHGPHLPLATDTLISQGMCARMAATEHAVIGNHKDGLEQPDGDSERAEQLRLLVRGHLSQYKYPRDIKFVDQLPLTPNGKVDRRALKIADAEARAAVEAG